MNKLIWNQNELMAEHQYARPHREVGMELHGGFDEKGNYISPRTKYRWNAVKAWQKALAQKNLPLLDASSGLLKAGSYPNSRQQLLLLAHGFGYTFWNALTITGIIEARGAMLVEYTPPDMQSVIEEDISQTAVGHLHKGLLVAHGLDEGGDPSNPDGPGAHDQMWFAVRDMVFGQSAYPQPKVPPSLERPKDGAFFPELDDPYDLLFTLLTDVLMIEVRADAFFDFCEQVLSAPQSFPGKQAEKKLATEMVGRIRIDESIHVAYLRTVLSELRGLTFKGKNGAINGADMIDPVWQDMVMWHGQTQYTLARERMHDALLDEIHAQLGEKAENFIAQFDAAADPNPQIAAE